jgi:hypothetical protein
MSKKAMNCSSSATISAGSSLLMILENKLAIGRDKETSEP